MFAKKFGVILVALLTAASPAFVSAAMVQLNWQPNTELDLNGYNIYVGTESRQYAPPIPAGNATSYEVTDLEEGRVYFFALTAVDNSGNESGFSNEISKQAEEPSSPITPPNDNSLPTVTITSPTRNGQITLSTATVDIGGTASDDVGIEKVIWRNSRGESGTCDGTTNWNAAGIILDQWMNTVTVTAIDTSGKQREQRLVIYRTFSASNNPATPTDSNPPRVTITTPTQSNVFTTSSKIINLAGTASDDQSVTKITWETSTGLSGTATGTANWSVSNITIVGDTHITITAVDGAGNTSSDILNVSYKSDETTLDTSPPSVTITSPTRNAMFMSRIASVDIGGTASDDVGIEKVIWRNSRGESGTCDGTTNWNAAGITLDQWMNTVTVTAIDTSGKQREQRLTIYRY